MTFRRALPGIAMAVVGIVLIYVLFLTFGASGAMFTEAFSGAPWQLYPTLATIVFLNALVGAAKWRTAIRWLEPHARMPTIIESFELTILGLLFGQFMPVQVSTAAVRWVAAPKASGSRFWSLRSTLYEQVYDLFVMLAAGAAGIVIIVVPLAPSSAGFALAATVILAFIAMRRLFGLGAAISASIAKVKSFARAAKAFDGLADALARAAAAPHRTALVLLGYSLARLVLHIAYAVIVALVFAPQAKLLLVAAGFPLAVLAAAIPVAPGGLGVVEWTWGGLLVLAGALPASAAITALAHRIFYLILLCCLTAALVPLKLFGIRGLT